MATSFELGIPTHIRFTLYRYDYIDGLIISNVLRECADLSTIEGVHTVQVDEFKQAILGSRRLKREALKAESFKPGMKENVNSAFFLWQILHSFPNMELLSFNISDEKEFTRIIKINETDAVNFQFKIEEGYLDLPSVLSRPDLDELNKICMRAGIISNKYLDRSAYFYINMGTALEVIQELGMLGSTAAQWLLDLLDPKLEEDDPIVLVKTDYTPY